MEELIAFIAEQSGTKINKINKDSLLEKELGIYGDDAYDLLVAYSEEFHVDVSRFDYLIYFSPECTPILRNFFNQRKTKELSVTDLYNGILKGELV